MFLPETMIVRVLDPKSDQGAVRYKVTVSAPSNPEAVLSISWRRFSEFDAVFRRLAEMKPEPPLPKLPEKRLFGTSDPSFIEQRRREIEAFVVAVCSNRFLVNDVEFLTLVGYVAAKAAFSTDGTSSPRQPKQLLQEDPPEQWWLLPSVTVQIKDEANLLAAQSYLRSTGYTVEKLLPPLSWRASRKTNILLRDSYNNQFVLSVSPVVPLRSFEHDEKRQTYVSRLLLGIALPCFASALEVFMAPDRLYVIRKVQKLGSLRDVMFGATWSDDSVRKFKNKSNMEAVFQQGPWTATFRPTYQQPKGSIECGLHLLVNAFAIAQGNCHEPAPGTIATYDYIRPGLANAITDETAFNALLAGFRVARGSPLSSGSPMGHVATILAQNNDQNQLAHDHEWQPFDKKTVDAHKRAANLFSVAVQQNFADCPFKELTKVLQHLETTRHWSPPTTLKFALDLRAAILRSPLETEIVHLHWFKDLLRMLKKRVARQANQAIRPHMLVPEALILIERAKTTSDELAAWIALTWLTAGRPSNTLRLTTLNLRDVTQAGFTILWTDAKTVGTTGPYSTFSGWGRHRFLQAYLESQLTRATESRAPTNLFPTLRRTAHRATRTLLSHIRRVNPAYDSRTMRRGTLIAMAEAGTPDATLLQLSGHRTMTTLYRYLAWGRHNSVARDTLQACANDTL